MVMNLVDVECPLCRRLNIGIDLDETGGWMECIHCDVDVVPLGYIYKALKSWFKPMNIPEYTMDSVKNLVNN